MVLHSENMSTQANLGRLGTPIVHEIYHCLLYAHRIVFYTPTYYSKVRTFSIDIAAGTRYLYLSLCINLNRLVSHPSRQKAKGRNP
jgi:hypothetical protein